MINEDIPRFEYPGLWPNQPGRCRLRIYQLDGMLRLIVVATELADNPGASITNCAEQLATAVWRQFQRGLCHPPIMIEHYNRASYDPDDRAPGTDRYSLVEFAEHRRDLPPTVNNSVIGPRWSHVPPEFVARLTGDPTLDPAATVPLASRRLDPITGEPVDPARLRRMVGARDLETAEQILDQYSAGRLSIVETVRQLESLGRQRETDQ